MSLRCANMGPWMECQGSILARYYASRHVAIGGESQVVIQRGGNGGDGQRIPLLNRCVVALEAFRFFLGSAGP
eukprot:745594-Hanusia_phi.AAC.1